MGQQFGNGQTVCQARTSKGPHISNEMKHSGGSRQSPLVYGKIRCSGIHTPSDLLFSRRRVDVAKAAIGSSRSPMPPATPPIMFRIGHLRMASWPSLLKAYFLPILSASEQQRQEIGCYRDLSLCTNNSSAPRGRVCLRHSAVHTYQSSELDLTNCQTGTELRRATFASCVVAALRIGSVLTRDPPLAK